jgi:hypothetical protein
MPPTMDSLKQEKIPSFLLLGAMTAVALALVFLHVTTILDERFSSKEWKTRELWNRGRRVASTREVLKTGLPKSEVFDLLGPAEQCRGPWVEWEYLDGTHGKWLSVRFENGKIAEVELNQGHSYPSSETVEEYTAQVRH